MLVSTVDLIQTLNFAQFGLTEMNPIVNSFYQDPAALSSVVLGSQILLAWALTVQPRLCRVMPIVLRVHVAVVSLNDVGMRESGYRGGQVAVAMPLLTYRW